MDDKDDKTKGKPEKAESKKEDTSRTESIDRLEVMLNDRLRELEQREEQLREYDETLRKKEEEWEQRIKSEELKVREELARREEELRKREKELETMRVMVEEEKLKEREIALSTIQDEIRREQEKLEVKKKAWKKEETRTIDSIKNKIVPEISGVKSGAMILVSSKSEEQAMTSIALLDTIIKDNTGGCVYISISKPYDDMLRSLAERKIPEDDVFFIDCISIMAGRPTEKKDNVVFIENPASLEEISMYVDRSIKKIKSNKKFLFLDSISSLLIYNSAKSTEEFVHLIVNKMRLNDVGGILLSVEKKEVEEIVKIIRQICDKEIKI